MKQILMLLVVACAVSSSDVVTSPVSAQQLCPAVLKAGDSEKTILRMRFIPETRQRMVKVPLKSKRGTVYQEELRQYTVRVPVMEQVVVSQLKVYDIKGKELPTSRLQERLKADKQAAVLIAVPGAEKLSPELQKLFQPDIMIVVFEEVPGPDPRPAAPIPKTPAALPGGVPAPPLKVSPEA